jgi:hypothetical protein
VDTGPQASAASAAGPAAARGSARAPVPALWFLLPLAWCAWLLVWLAPALLLAPHVSVLSPWLRADAAPGAVTAAAALFLSIFWPFWPALAAGNRGPRSLVARSLLEAAMLLALAAPFVLVAFAVADRRPDIGRLAAAAAGLGVWGLGLRLATAGLGPRAARWLIAAALLVAAAPVAVSYAGSETISVAFPWLLPASPVIGSTRLVIEGWPADAGSWLVQAALWPAAGVGLAILGGRGLKRRGAKR